MIERATREKAKKEELIYACCVISVKKLTSFVVLTVDNV